MDGITLPPDLDRFADEAIADGHYPDKAAVVAAGVELLRRYEAARAGLLASVLAAEQESDREGWLSSEEVFAHIDARLAARTPNAA